MTAIILSEVFRRKYIYSTRSTHSFPQQTLMIGLRAYNVLVSWSLLVDCIQLKAVSYTGHSAVSRDIERRRLIGARSLLD